MSSLKKKLGKKLGKKLDKIRIRRGAVNSSASNFSNLKKQSFLITPSIM